MMMNIYVIMALLYAVCYILIILFMVVILIYLFTENNDK